MVIFAASLHIGRTALFLSNPAGGKVEHGVAFGLSADDSSRAVPQQEGVVPHVSGKGSGAAIPSAAIIASLKRSSDVIVDYVRGEHDLLLAPRTAFDVVRFLVRGHLDHDDVFAEVRGRDLPTGHPKTIVLSRLELRDAIRGS